MIRISFLLLVLSLLFDTAFPASHKAKFYIHNGSVLYRACDMRQCFTHCKRKEISNWSEYSFCLMAAFIAWGRMNKAQ